MTTNTKIRGRVAIFCAVFFLGAGVAAFSQPGVPDLDELTRAMDTFAGSMALALPFNASMGLNWSDAYIGKLFPSRPPHFGIGFAGGFTTMGLGPIEGLLDVFGADLPDLPFRGLPIPGMMAEARIGGLFLPFDMGFKIGFLPAGVTNMLGDTLSLDYFVVGGDFRYALIEAGRIVPALSLGMGLTHLRGGIGVGVGDVSIGFDIPVELDIPGLPPIREVMPGTLTIQNPQMGIDWSTTVLDFKLHVSRPLFIITPYVGLGMSHGWSRVSYGASVADIRARADDLDLELSLSEIREIFGEHGIDVTETSFSSEVGISGWSFRAFGGVSFNFPFFRLDFTGLWNMRDGNLGATVGFRFQM